MIKFLDGPAAGKTIWLRRAPIYLRVVIDGETVDALDQLDDTPKASETIHAYRVIGKPSWIHLCVRGKDRSGGGYWGAGEYEVCDPQPDEATMRDNERWREWATEQYQAGKTGTEATK